MSHLLERIRNGEILIGDGATGTMLIERGLKPGECPELLNLTQPELLEEIALLYCEAGADLIETNTFGASPMRLSCYSLEDKTEEINTRAVEAVKKVVGKRAYVSASCGPSGKILKPYGTATPEELSEGFARQIRAMIQAGADVICVETMSDIEEAKLAVYAAKKIAPEIPVIATMTFDHTQRGFYTVMGVNVKTAAQGLEEAGADIIGSNCGNGIDNMIQIAAEFKRHTRLPLIFQPNAGLPRMQGDRMIYTETPEYMAEKSRDLLRIGISILGGCCGTGPDHIRAFRKTVDHFRVK